MDEKHHQILNALSTVFGCETNSLTPETSLDTLAWDSLARVTLLAMARTRFSRRLTGAELLQFKTVGEIIAALER